MQHLQQKLMQTFIFVGTIDLFFMGGNNSAPSKLVLGIQNLLPPFLLILLLVPFLFAPMAQITNQL